MIPEGGKMNQVAIQFEGRYPVTDGFPGLRCRFPDGLPQFMQFLLDIAGKLCNIVVNGPDRFSSGIHDPREM
jgi:hypothetical protein